MNDKDNIPENLKDLLDAYLSEALDEDGVAKLEELLRTDEAARQYFVRYCRLHTDLYQVARASQAGKNALSLLQGLPGGESAVPQVITPAIPPKRFWQRYMAGAGAIAALLFIGVLTYLLLVSSAPPSQAVAWVLNAQNCEWKQDLAPSGEMLPGKVLALERGLVEIEFGSGATVLLNGPASMELKSSNSAQLRYGKLTARVPKQAIGFSILSPEGKIVDLGTEFGISVAQSGATEVFVFEGEVTAQPRGEKAAASVVSIKENQGARIEAGAVSLKEEAKPAELSSFVREITTPPVIIPQHLRLNFRAEAPGTILDSSGIGTGLTHRLPGTGKDLLQHDVNLKLNPSESQLELTTTDSDINRRRKLETGEYLGFRLADLGFTGREDFEVTVTIPDIPALERVGQFGVYAGSKADRNIRGGLISSTSGEYKLFMVNNNGGTDSNPHFVGLYASGEDMRMTLRREAGKYTLAIENLTTGSASTLAIKHPAFLDDEKDMYVGIFAANTQSQVTRKLSIKGVEATVWKLSK